MRHNWQVRLGGAVLAAAVWTVMSLAGADFCLAQDQAAQIQAPAPAKAKVEKARRKKKRPVPPRTISLFQDGYDPTVPPSPEADLKNRLRAPLQPGQAEQGAGGVKYEIGEKLRLAPGAAPAPSDGHGAGGGLRASWQSKGNMAVSGGVGYDTEGRSGAASPSPAGPSENASPGPAAGVMLKYSF